MSPGPNVAIVGGGIAGAALAAELAGAGFEVHLFERSSFPRDKLCGEFLSSEAPRLLQRLGCWSRVQALAPVSISNARITSAGGSSLELSLPAPGLGLSRWALDAALIEHAQRAGAHVHLRAEVRGSRRSGRGFVLSGQALAGAGEPFEHYADWVAGAYGRRSKLDRELGRRFLRRSHPYLGFKQHHRPRDDARGAALSRALQGVVELHAVDGGYCGLSFVESGRVNVCMLLEERRFRGLADRSLAGVFAALAAENGALGARLEALVADGSPMESVAQVPFTPKELVKDGVFFLGDAAGVVAPLAGDGQAMALESALLLAALLRRHGLPRSAAGRARLELAWRLRWQATFGVRLALGRQLQTLLLSGRTADRALGFLDSNPALSGVLARLLRSPA